MRIRYWSEASLVMLTLTGAGPALAQTADQDAGRSQVDDGEADLDDGNTILVTGRTQRQRGAVVGDVPPIQQLNAGDVRALGVSSVAELLAELSPQTRSGQGRGGEQPVTLLNGRRISGFREIRDIPTEAIERVDILPEEVALKYGYSADQRVVNIVLRRRFRAFTGEVEGGMSTRGGAETGQVELNFLRIQRDRRLNINLEYQASAAISEAERDLVSRSGSRPFDRLGNVVGAPAGSAIPALGSLAGQPVTIAGVPASAANARPPLGDFVTTANRANSTDLARFRTIRPESRSLDLNAVYALNLFGTVATTINASLGLTDSDSLRGLPGASLTLPGSNPYSPFGGTVTLLRYLGDRALTQGSSGSTGHIGFTLDKDLAGWRASLTGNYDRAITNTRTVRGIDVTDLQAALLAGDPMLNPFGTIPAALLGMQLVDRARAKSDSGDVQLVVNGTIVDLPAGPVSVSLKGGFSALWLDATSFRSGIVTSGDLSRTDLNGRASLDLPVTSRKNHVLPALGDLSLNINAAADGYSDFGTLVSYGYGLNWKPRDGVGLIASVTHDRNPPSVQQLGNPLVVTPDVRSFDYVRGTTVDIIQLGGGNPLLDADRRRVIKLGLTLKPFERDISFSANYVHSRIRNAVASFPEATAAIEAAFPDRFTRDADDNLLRLDARPINFARQERSELRWGFTFSRRLKTAQTVIDAMRNSATARRMAERRAAGQAARQGGRDGPPMGGFGGRGGARGGGQGGRFQVSMFHTWHLTDKVVIRPGLPVLDLINGDVIGSGGGQPRHEIEGQMTYANNGVGGRLTANWQSGTTVNGSAGATTGSLRFAPRLTTSARLFVNLSQIPALVDSGWARGARISLRVDNIFDSRPRVRDAAGATPLRYQPGYLDPVGRLIRIEFRKLIF